MGSLELYTYWRSSSAYRVRIGLALKGLPYTSKRVDLLAGDQESDAFKRLSPMGYVPCLVIDGRPVVESLAILELLDDLFPERPLFPSEPWARARVRGLVEIINAGTQPLQNLVVLKAVSDDGEKRKAWARSFIARGLAAFERMLEVCEAEGSRGPFAFGPEPGAADCFLVPQVYNARRFEVSLDPWPRIRRAVDASATDERFRAAAPECQADAPKE